MHRPGDGDVMTLREALEWQRSYVQAGGAAVAAEVLTAVLDDEGGARLVADLLPERVRFGDLPGLRIMAAVHLLALQGRAPRVAAHAPTLGGIPPGPEQLPAFHSDVVACLVEHPHTLAEVMSHPPQTNEVGRAPLLRLALTRLGTRQPVRLREFGCSAGLNLRADHLPGDPALETGPLPRVLDRVGCDLRPIDAASVSGQLALSSYVWMDDVPRMDRLRAAVAVAERVPATILQCDAAAFINDLVLADGTTTVVWHSAMWVYLDPQERASIRSALADLAGAATSNARLAHVSWEWAAQPDSGERAFHLVLRSWSGAADDGRPLLLAEGNGHGKSVTALPGGGRWLDEEPLSS